jgi:hypothetical protein
MRLAGNMKSGTWEEGDGVFQVEGRYWCQDLAQPYIVATLSLCAIVHVLLIL